MSSTIRFRHSNRSSPAYLPAAAVILPSKPMTVRTGRWWRFPISKSVGSWPGVTLITPVPNFGSTAVSATTWMEMVPSTEGTSSVLPTYFRYRLSLGWTASAVSPSLVSGRTVPRVRGPYLM